MIGLETLQEELARLSKQVGPQDLAGAKEELSTDPFGWGRALGLFHPALGGDLNRDLPVFTTVHGRLRDRNVAQVETLLPRHLAD